MSTLTAENVIPTYSLSKSTSDKASTYYISQPNGSDTPEKPFFLEAHRKDFYMLVLVKQGSSRHWVDMVPYTVRPNKFYFTIPHQVHLKESMLPMEGTVLCFTDEFLALGDNNDLKQLPIIQNRRNGHELSLNPDDVQFIEDLLDKTMAEFEQSNDWKNGMLHAYLRVLLIYLSRLYTQQFETGEPSTERTLLRRFQEFINEHYLQLHDVASYAGLLNISAGHLGEVIKQQSGKSAIELIHERILVEAKRLLFHTEQSVKELSYQLGFSDVSYFVRFFKRLSAQTPVEYRTTSRKMYHPNL